jgi:hypothetical protein
MAIEWEEAVRPIIDGAGLLPRPEPEPLREPDTPQPQRDADTA